MTFIFKPMLATDADLDKLAFPLLASAKLDGVRAVVRDGIVYSRSNKPIPNKFVQQKFSRFEHFDGELIVGEPTSHTVYRDTVSIVMSDEKPADDVHFYVFDHVAEIAKPYVARLMNIKGWGVRHDTHVLSQLPIETHDELIAHEAAALEAGYEGLILRDPDAPYKMGRSTVKEGYLLKLKRFCDAEAVVIGFEERMENQNEATVNELGRTRRSSHKAGKVGRGDLGALVCRTAEGVEFSIGTGLDDATREDLWAIRNDDLIGRIVKYKFFPVGVKDKPRHPVFLGWRMKEDV